MSDCTVLVTDKIRRTTKFLCMASKGVPIVQPNWIKLSKETRFFQGKIKFFAPFVSLPSFDLIPDPWKHLVEDHESEKKWGFDLRGCLKGSSKSPLLAGYKVHGTKSVLPPPDQLKGKSFL